MARMKNLIREIIPRRIGQSNAARVLRMLGFGETPTHIIIDPVLLAAPALATSDGLLFPIRAALNPYMVGRDAHFFGPILGVSLKGYMKRANTHPRACR